MLNPSFHAWAWMEVCFSNTHIWIQDCCRGLQLLKHVGRAARLIELALVALSPFVRHGWRQGMEEYSLSTYGPHKHSEYHRENMEGRLNRASLCPTDIGAQFHLPLIRGQLRNKIQWEMMKTPEASVRPVLRAGSVWSWVIHIDKGSCRHSPVTSQKLKERNWLRSHFRTDELGLQNLLWFFVLMVCLSCVGPFTCNETTIEPPNSNPPSGLLEPTRAPKEIIPLKTWKMKTRKYLTAWRKM